MRGPTGREGRDRPSPRRYDREGQRCRPHLGALWERQRFASSEEASRSPLMTIDEITMREIGIVDADRHLRPGWPGHPRSRG
jgi:hypothetical protein